MKLKSEFSMTLSHLRSARALTQEDFSSISSRTNISLLERAKSIPTLEKLEQLCSVLTVHPLTIMAICDSTNDHLSVDAFLVLVVAFLPISPTRDNPTRTGNSVLRLSVMEASLL